MRVALFIIGLLIMPMVMGQTEDIVTLQVTRSVAGVLPSSPFYSIERFWEDRIEVPNAKDKAAKYLELAEERIAEGKVETDNERVSHAKTAFDDYEKKVAKVAEEQKGLDDEKRHEVLKGLEKSRIVLNGIISRFESDDNPNNDHAIDALKRARDRTRDAFDDTGKDVKGKRKSIEDLQREIVEDAKDAGEVMQAKVKLRTASTAATEIDTKESSRNPVESPSMFSVYGVEE